MTVSKGKNSSQNWKCGSTIFDGIIDSQTGKRKSEKERSGEREKCLKRKQTGKKTEKKNKKKKKRSVNYMRHDNFS